MNMSKGLACVAFYLTVLLPLANAAHAQSPATTLPKTPIAVAPTAPKADDVDALFARWDTDHNGELSPQEFRIGWHQLQATTELRRLHEQFVAMDTDKNGCLNSAEYSHLTLIQRAGNSAPPLAMFDTEKNQCLDFKEYVNLVDYLLKHERK